MSIAAAFSIPLEDIGRQRETTLGFGTATARRGVELSPPIFDFSDLIIIKEYIL